MARVTLFYQQSLLKSLPMDIGELELVAREVVQAAFTDYREQRRPKSVRTSNQKQHLRNGSDLQVVVHALRGCMSDYDRARTRRKLQAAFSHVLGSSVRFGVLLALDLEAWEVGGTYLDTKATRQMGSVAEAIERALRLIQTGRREQSLTQPVLNEADGAKLKQLIAGQVAPAT